MAIEDRIKEERQRLGLNQGDFGKLLGVALRTQSNYESGKRKPDSDYFMAMYNNGIDVGYVLTGQRTVTLDDLVELQQCVLEVEEWLQKNKKELQKEQLLNAAKQLFKAKREQVPVGTAIDLILNTATSA